MSGDSERGAASVQEDDVASLEIAARIFLQSPHGRDARATTPVVVGEPAVRKVAERLAEGSPALLGRLRRAVARHQARPTWRSREQVVEAVTAVALSLVLKDDMSRYDTVMEGELG